MRNLMMGLYGGVIKLNKGESRYSSRSTVLIKIGVTEDIWTRTSQTHSTTALRRRLGAPRAFYDPSPGQLPPPKSGDDVWQPGDRKPPQLPPTLDTTRLHLLTSLGMAIFADTKAGENP
ncbi:hypothetical protein J6590_011711 [Homalodisca vitripennis]|nr:hypothetical protein J6590_011711 [Homalodisca vitripennis]